MKLRRFKRGLMILFLVNHKGNWRVRVQGGQTDDNYSSEAKSMYLCKKQGVKVKSYDNRSQHRHRLASPSTSVSFTSAAITASLQVFQMPKTRCGVHSQSNHWRMIKYLTQDPAHFSSSVEVKWAKNKTNAQIAHRALALSIALQG